MLLALIFVLADVAIFLAVVGASSELAKRHHYYEDPDEDKEGVHHGAQGDVCYTP